MHATRGSRRWNKRNVRMMFILLAVWFIQFEQFCPAAQSEGPTAERSRVYKMNHRSAEEIKGVLLQLGIGRRVDALSEKILIVTSDKPDDLIRASSVIQMLDSQSARLLRQWKREAVGLPTIEFLAAELKLPELQSGTLLDPPPSNASDPLLLDEYGEGLLAIASPERIEQLDNFIRQWISKNQPKPAASAVEAEEPNQAPAAEPTAKPAEKEETAAVEPNQPAASAAIPPVSPAEEPNQLQPSAEPAADEPKEEDFFSEELMKALISAQEKAEEIQKQIETEKQTAATESDEEKAFAEIIEALRQRTVGEQAEEEQAEAPVAPTPAAQPSPAEGEAASSSLLARLEEQLARQEQQIAELKAMLAQTSRPAAAEPKIQTAPKPSEPVIPEGEKELELTITLPEKVEITALLELVGKQLGLNYMYDPSQVRGDVQLKIHDGKIKVKDTYALLESVMRFKGFVMTRRGNLVTIVPVSQMKQADPALRKPNEPIQPGDVVVSSVFPLQYISPAAAQKMLTDMQLGTSFVAANETNTLIVTDYAYRMDSISQVIALVDVAGEPKRFAFRQMQYTSAPDILNKLKTLTAQMSGINVIGTDGSPAEEAQRAAATPTVRRDAQGRVIATRPPQATPQPAAPTPAGPTQETIFLDTDERTNRILMIGYEAQIQTIQGLIDTLDVPKYYLRTVKEYFIQNVEAAEVVSALNELGLANVNVGASSTARTTAARPTTTRTAAQPGQPTPAQPAVSTPPAGEDQPYISIRPNTNSLLVNATKDQHEAIEMVISHVDVKQKDQRTIQEYEIQNVDALTVVKTLEDLGIIAPGKSEESSRGQTRSTTTSGRQLQGAAAAQPGQPELPTAIALPTIEGETVTEVAATQPQIAVLESTNSLLMLATPRQHEAISLVIAHVDRTLERVSTPYVVYPLENQDPEELAAVLNELIQETLEQAQKSSPDAKIQTSPSGAAPTAPAKEEERIRIIADPKTYSLIVYANKKNQQWVGDLIRELDQYRPQVLLDCTLVEVTKDDLFKYELDLVSKTYSDLSLRPGLTGTLGNTTSTIGNLGGSTSFDPRTYGHASTNSGIFTGFFNSDMVQGVLTAMQQKNYGRIMARPQILVNDNQEGEIKTEEKQAVAKVKTTVLPGTATEKSTASQEATFEDYTAGVTLTIKPHISKGDMLRLEIKLNRTDFGATTKTISVADGAGGTTPVPYPPDRTTTDISTVSTIPDGATIILGGLEKIKQSKVQQKVPLLGDLPLVGGLFRDVSNTDTQGKLYVFVKANILRPGDRGGMEDMRQVSGHSRRAFEEYERQFQLLDDWPGIPPRPLDPRRVLEEDKIELSEEEHLY